MQRGRLRAHQAEGVGGLDIAVGAGCAQHQDLRLHRRSIIPRGDEGRIGRGVEAESTGVRSLDTGPTLDA